MHATLFFIMFAGIARVLMEFIGASYTCNCIIAFPFDLQTSLFSIIFARHSLSTTYDKANGDSTSGRFYQTGSA